MAGIGFTLKKLFKEDIYSKRVGAYIYTAFVAAGPWISAVVTMNMMLFISKKLLANYLERELIMGSIVYAFVFSQILTAPFQLVITRYVSDQLFEQKYKNIRASFLGLTNIIAAIAVVIGAVFFIGKPLPFQYKFLIISLFVIISLMWILMVFLSAIKNYIIISAAYVIGGVMTIGLTVLTSYYPIPFEGLQDASNVIFSFLSGIIVTYIILLYSFLRAFQIGSKDLYDFLRYIDKYSSLVFIGGFYTLGLWIDNLIMWGISSHQRNVYDVFYFAPVYDNAVFLANLTIIPTMMLFIISVETEFYDQYKQYYGLASGNGTLKQLKERLGVMKTSLIRELIFTFESQTIISLFIIAISGQLFVWFGGSLLVRDIFRITALGSLCNIFILIMILVLLYFEARKQAVIVSFSFFALNGILTYFLQGLGESYYGLGFFMSSFITLVLSMILFYGYIKELNYITFGKTLLVQPEEKGLFVTLASLLRKIH